MGVFALLAYLLLKSPSMPSYNPYRDYLDMETPILEVFITAKDSSDVKHFHKELKGGAFVSEYAFVSASYANGEPLLVVQDVETGKV